MHTQKKITTHHLWVIKLLNSRLYLLFERPLTHRRVKQKLQDKLLVLQLYQ